MTAHVHDPVPPEGSTDLSLATAPTVAPAVRPRWLVPVALGAIVVGGLVAGGFLSLSTVLYAGLIGGMLLMHVGGHGHGGHGGSGHGTGGHGGGGDRQGGDGGGPGLTSANLRQGSSDAQREDAASAAGLDAQAANETMENGNRDRDRPSSGSCH